MRQAAAAADPATTRTLAETLEGRLPVLPDRRLYSGFAGFLWTCSALATASYAYLVGASLPSLGNTWLGIGGYCAGTIIGMVLVSFAVGIPSFKYGLDTVDVAKAALGARGSLIFMGLILLSCVGWSNVLIAMTARAAGNIIGELNSPAASGIASEPVVVLSAAVIVGAVWWLTCRGPQIVERLNSWCVPGQLLVAALLLILMLIKYGAGTLLHANVPTRQALTTDHTLQLTFAVEFGLSNAFTMLPFLGGLTRLAKRRRLAVGPPVIGYSIGAGFISGVAALAATASGSVDPLVWLKVVAGLTLGSIALLFLMAANIGALVTLVYLGSISIQQIGPLARLPWRATVAIVLAPSILVAFNTQNMLDRVMQWLTYNGVMFVGLTAVLIVDFFILRRQILAPAHLFTRSRHGLYWYTGGVNIAALSVVLGATIMYFVMYDPVTLQVASVFRYLGAAVPIMALSGLVYAIAMNRRWTGAPGRERGADHDVIELSV